MEYIIAFVLVFALAMPLVTRYCLIATALTGLLAAAGCAASQRPEVKEELPFSHYEKIAVTEAPSYSLVDDYSYGGVTLLSPVPSLARPVGGQVKDEVQLFRLDEVDSPFDFAVLEASEGRVIDLTLVKAFETKNAARKFFSAAYAAMAEKYSKLIPPVSNGSPSEVNSFTLAYWSFSRREDWIEHVAEIRKSRAEMAWLYQGRGYQPSSAISEVLAQATLGLHTPEETGKHPYHVTISYKTHIRRELASNARQELINKLDL